MADVVVAGPGALWWVGRGMVEDFHFPELHGLTVAIASVRVSPCPPQARGGSPGGIYIQAEERCCERMPRMRRETVDQNTCLSGLVGELAIQNC